MKAIAGIAAVAMLVVACSGGDGVELREWTLVRAGGSEPVTVPLGAFSFHDARTELHTTLHLDRLVGPRTLVIDCFHDDIAVIADGVTLEDRGYARVGEHRWVIPAELAERPQLELTIVAQRSNMFAVGLATVPRLVPGVVQGHGAIAMFNHNVAIAELALIAVMVLLYGALYLLERRRGNLAVVIGSLICTPAPLWQLGLLAPMFGRFMPAVLLTAISGANLAILAFLHDMYDFGRIPRWLTAWLVVVPIASLGAGTSFAYATVLDAATFGSSFAVVAATFPKMWRLAHSSNLHRVDARLMLTSVLISSAIVLPDLIGLFSGHATLGGAHTISLGVIAEVATMALLLVHHHVARQQVLERTGEELRRQVAQRSRELGDALAKLGSSGSGLGLDRVIDDRYRVVKRLGAGGMGTVYEVERTSDGEHLALKTLRGAADPELMARFAREAQIAAEMSHANLLPVIDVGIADGALFLVMPLVAGGSLEQARGKFGDAKWARPLLRQIASGLAVLHDKSIIHRDLKPGNILLAGDIARIADFGLATLRANAVAETLAASSASGALDATAPANATPLTRVGDVFGTPKYMAPELAVGVEDAAPASDVFAFGVIAYELLFNRQPFAEPPVLARLHGRPFVPPITDGIGPIDPIVLRCLDLEPSARPTAAELEAAW